MKQRDAMLVFGAVVLAVGVSALLLASSLATARSTGARERIFFDPRNSPPPALTVVEAQRGVPVALQPVVPFQRGVSDRARDAAGYLLVLLGTSAALVLAREQVVRTYRASLGDWRAQLRVLASGLAVLGVGASAAALIGFAAAAWRLGDALFGLQLIKRFAGTVPAPLIALLGATLIYIAWQLPYVGAPAVVLAVAYALGAVVTARLAPGTPQTAQ